MVSYGKIMAGLLEFTDRLILTVSRWYYRNCFIFCERVRCRRLKIGSANCFDVPVRGDGSGVLSIGSQNNFGFRPAPLLGNGQILLQARRPESELVIGSRNMFSNNVSIVATKRVIIGNTCRFGDQVVIIDSDFHEISPALRETNAGPSEPVYIGNNVWLGSRVMVLKGVTIGDNTVIGAMSLVNKSLPSNCVAAGNPAKVIRTIE
jgi:maltose O-acetyltransferase